MTQIVAKSENDRKLLEQHGREEYDRRVLLAADFNERYNQWLGDHTADKMSKEMAEILCAGDHLSEDCFDNGPDGGVWMTYTFFSYRFTQLIMALSKEHLDKFLAMPFQRAERIVGGLIEKGQMI
jgi:hypothetical protein